MYPNYSKAFLDLEGIVVKKVLDADSFLKVSIETHPTEQYVLVVAVKSKSSYYRTVVICVCTICCKNCFTTFIGQSPTTRRNKSLMTELPIPKIIVS